MNIKRFLSIFLAVSFIVSPSWAEDKTVRSPEILKWEPMVAKKGFILSNQLYYEQGCSQIWEKQVPAFQKKNKHIEDPDVISKGTKMTIQLCRSKEESKPVPAPVKKTKKPDPTPTPVVKEVEEKLSNPYTSPYIHLFGGFLTENEKFEKIDGAYGIGVTGDLFRFLGYNIRLLGSRGVAFLQNEVRFKTSPDNKTRGHLIFGFGNRLGLQNKDLDRLNKGVDSFNYAGLGLEMHPHPRYRFGLDLTANFGKEISPNVGVYAQKRLGDDNWLGVYAEYNSSRSSVDDSKSDRRYLTGGIKFSF